MSDFNHAEGVPDFEYNGELVQHLIIDNRAIYKYDDIDRIIVTSHERRKKEMGIIHVYYQGKRKFGKRVDSSEPVYEECLGLVRVIINEVTWGENYEGN